MLLLYIFSKQYFSSFQNTHGSQMSINEFINRPVHHFQDLCGVLTAILDSTNPKSQEREVFFAVVQGKINCFVFISSPVSTQTLGIIGITIVFDMVGKKAKSGRGAPIVDKVLGKIFLM